MQRDSKIYLIVGLILAIVIVIAVVYVAKNNSGPGQLDEFATCLKDQGAVFYGTFWCPHCIATKKLFGKSAKLLPYVECSTPDGSGQTQVCIDKKIESYPTWIFKNDSQLHGEVTLEQLSEKTSCPITPGGAISTTTASTTDTFSTVGTSTTIKIK
jgi:thiol-disulfide isomerase/thioredoxin